MSEDDRDIDVESDDVDVPEVGLEATASTSPTSPTVSQLTVQWSVKTVHLLHTCMTLFFPIAIMLNTGMSECVTNTCLCCHRRMLTCPFLPKARTNTITSPHTKVYGNV